LQLNTNFFTTQCSKSELPQAVGNQCQGWAQFVYQAGPQTSVYVEYWLFNVSRWGCPSGWNSYSMPKTGGGSELYCYVDSPHTAAPYVSITKLTSLALSGSISHNGNAVTLSTGSGSPIASTASDYFGLAYGGMWTSAEFNVFGFGNGSSANFGIFTSATVGIEAGYGPSGLSTSVAAPSCGNASWTGETNNMDLGSCSPYAGALGRGIGPGHPVMVLKYPGIQFTEAVPFLLGGPLSFN
jgi:hypothetical protein